MRDPDIILLATRGSALALAQANLMLDQCRAAFPRLRFDIKVINTTGDKLETASLSQDRANLPKGLFTKELEVALLNGEADLAVHSLKDLPTELPEGLKLGAVTTRADVRDVLIYRTKKAECGVKHRRSIRQRLSTRHLSQGATVATSSTRRKAQLLAKRPDLNIVAVRGNIITRMRKLGEGKFEALVLAAAGLERMNCCIEEDGRLTGDVVPGALSAVFLDVDLMLPCVGQGALGIEVREGDERVAMVCRRLNDFKTSQCVLAERAFLAGMGGGCASPVAAYAEVVRKEIHMQAISFPDGIIRRTEGKRELGRQIELGEQLADRLKVAESGNLGSPIVETAVQPSL